MERRICRKPGRRVKQRKKESPRSAGIPFYVSMHRDSIFRAVPAESAVIQRRHPGLQNRFGAFTAFFILDVPPGAVRSEDRPQVFQHGDYHIGNMMIENGKLIIIDFDKSVVNDKEILATLSDVDCIGSVPYASPEVLKHESFDFSTDIWSAGITFFTMLTGQNLFLLSYPKQILTRLQMVELTSEFFIKKYNLSRLSARILENILCIEPNMRMTIDELLQSRWLKQ